MRLAAGCGHPATQVQRRWCAATGRCGHRPLRKTGKPHRSPRPAAHSEASAPAVARDGWESRQRPSPKYPSTPDNPSVSLRLTAPFTQGSLRDGGCGLPRRPVGPPRNDNGFLSFRGAERRGNPFLFTMYGGSGRRGRRPLRKVYRSPSNGPMWALAPTGGCREPPRLPGQRSERGKSRWSNSGFAR